MKKAPRKQRAKNRRYLPFSRARMPAWRQSPPRRPLPAHAGSPYLMVFGAKSVCVERNHPRPGNPPCRYKEALVADESFDLGSAPTQDRRLAASAAPLEGPPFRERACRVSQTWQAFILPSAVFRVSRWRHVFPTVSYSPAVFPTVRSRLSRAHGRETYVGVPQADREAAPAERKRHGKRA